MQRRDFLRLFGLGAAATAAAVIVPELLLPEPEKVRRYWAVPRNAPLRVRVDNGWDPEPIWLNAEHGFTYRSGEAFSLGSGTVHALAEVDADAAMANLRDAFNRRMEMTMLYGADASQPSDFVVTSVDTKRGILTLTGVRA